MHVLVKRNGSLQLRVGEHGEIERELDKSDALSLAVAFRAVVELEGGLTCAELIRALAPWGEILSRAAMIDFDAWLIEACHTPSPSRSFDAGPTADAESPLDAVVVSPVLVVHREDHRDRTNAVFEICWSASARYASPYMDPTLSKVLYCSLSFLPTKAWINLPLIIACSAEIENYSSLIMVDIFANEFGGAVQVVPTFFDVVVVGFLRKISEHGSPAESIHARAELLDVLDSVDE